GAAYQPADVATDRDVAAPGEGEPAIGDDHAKRTPAEDVVALLFHHEARAENPEDRARGADRRTVRADDQCARRAGQAGDEVEKQEPAGADPPFEQRAEPVEAEHVEEQVERSVVEEGGGHEPPPVALRDEGRVQKALVVDRAVDAVDATTLRQLRDVYGDVDPDQDLSHFRACAFEGYAAHSLGHPLDALRLPRVLRASDPDGRHGHALRADGPAAFRAGEAGHPVGMAVAGFLDGFSHARSSVVG